MACKNNCPACSCNNVQWQALRQALPHFKPITLAPDKIALLGARVGVTPQKLQRLIDKINGIAAKPFPESSKE